MTADLSVIIPSYNTGAYISEAVLSIAEDVPHAEIIVVDDASTDNTLARLEALELAQLKVITLEENSPGGAGHPSNVGIDVAAGEYIAFVDSDDFFMQGYLSGMLEQITSTGTDICVASYTLVDTLTHIEKPAYDAATWAACVGSNDSGTLSMAQYFTLSPEPWRKIYHRHIFDNPNVRFPVNGWFNEDYPFHWLCALQAREGICFSANDDYLHRISRAGQTTAALDDRIFFLFDHTDVIREFMRATPSESYEGYLLNWVLVGAWKLRRLEVRREEYYERYRALLKSFQPQAVEQFKGMAKPREIDVFQALLESADLQAALGRLRWDKPDE